MYGEEFIYQEYLYDLNICDDIINYFENSNEKHKGLTRGIVKPEMKDSTDCDIERNTLEYKNYFQQLQKVVYSYIKKFPRCNSSLPWSVLEHTQIQKYEPGQGYHTWHAERPGVTIPVLSRHLVFMTYLNDVTDGGGTEFYHQKLITKARKGLTLIWPSDWTFTHRSEVSPTQTKYIITGWFNHHRRT